MKVLMFSGSQTFMLCCVRWPDMAVIKTASGKQPCRFESVKQRVTDAWVLNSY